VGAAVNSSHPPIGALLREWRASRRMSQLDLALEAGISARHLSCVETGKSQASRETVGRLANALGMPLREHNLLMLAAGFAPQFSESPLYTSVLERMNKAIELILRQQEPYPAFVISRHWEILLRNQAGSRIISSPTQEHASQCFRSRGFSASHRQLDRYCRLVHPTPP
jgi:transcriptional regulator with XRE-family HTH domain